MTERKKHAPGAIGLELHGWLGIGLERDLFHRYARLGLVTLYVSTTALHPFLKMMAQARDVLRGRDGA